MSTCGGCGNSDPTKRCLGCMHDFGADKRWPMIYRLTEAQEKLQEDLNSKLKTASVSKLLRNGTPQTLLTNLLELADKGQYKEVIVLTIDHEDLAEFHCTYIDNNFKAVGAVEFLKRFLMER